MGGASERAHQRAVTFADGWLASLQTPDDLATARARLDRLAAERGVAPPRVGLITHVAVAARDSTALRAKAVAVLQNAYGLPRDDAERLAVSGTPAQVAEQLHRFVDLGVEHIGLINDAGPWQQTCELLATVKDQLG